MSGLIVIIGVSAVIVAIRLVCARPENTQYELGQESTDLRENNKSNKNINN